MPHSSRTSEVRSSVLSDLNPGKIVLGRVPIHQGAIEIGAPEDRPRTCLDVLVEHGLIEIRRTDQEQFNVRVYRSEFRQEPRKPHRVFTGLVESVILHGEGDGYWQIGGRDLEVFDSMGAQSFIAKIASAALAEERGDRGRSHQC
jgi:hypothetical protein